MIRRMLDQPLYEESKPTELVNKQTKIEPSSKNKILLYYTF
jgi:hypothetical protein